MANDQMATIRVLRDRLASAQRAAVAMEARTARLIAEGYTAVDRGWELVAWFVNVEGLGRFPVTVSQAPTTCPARR